MAVSQGISHGDVKFINRAGKNSNTGKSIFSSPTLAQHLNSCFFDIDLSSKEPANCAWATPLGTP